MKNSLLTFASLCIISLSFSCSASKNSVKSIADTYYGFLPCADCPGISYILDLTENGQYNLTMDYYERESTFTNKGKFTYENNQLTLHSNGEVSARFEREGNNLLYLDMKGNRIQSELSSYYILYKGNPDKAEMPINFGRENSTYIYKGTGNEPFWMVQITKENTMKFSGLMGSGEVEWEVPVTSTKLSDDSQSILYSGKKGPNALEVRIINEPCQDNMSGHYFASTLEVKYVSGDQVEQLQGCGSFLNEYALTGIWRLISAPGNPSISNEEITLGLYLPGDQIAGNAGCNRYFGSIDKVTDSYIQFSQVGATKMACPDMSLEDRYLRLLSRESIQWSLSGDDELTLSKNGDRFVFERANSL